MTNKYKILIVLLFMFCNNSVFSQIDTVRLRYDNKYSCTEKNITFYLQQEITNFQTEHIKQNYIISAISPTLSKVKIIEMVICYNVKNCFYQEKDNYIEYLYLADEKPSNIYTYYGYLPWEIYIIFKKYN